MPILRRQMPLLPRLLLLLLLPRLLLLLLYDTYTCPDGTCTSAGTNTCTCAGTCTWAGIDS